MNQTFSASCPCTDCQCDACMCCRQHGDRGCDGSTGQQGCACASSCGCGCGGTEQRCSCGPSAGA